MDIVVTSTKEVKVSAVRQAFQEVFGRADVQGVVSLFIYLQQSPDPSQGVYGHKVHVHYKRC